MSLFTSSSVKRCGAFLTKSHTQKLSQSIMPAALVSSFSTSSVCRSHIGSAPVSLPDGVSVTVTDKEIDSISRLRMELNAKRGGKYPINLTKVISIKGPRGELAIDLANFVNVDVENVDGSDARKAIVSVNEPTIKAQRSMWGTTRASLNNGVVGVTEGHISIVKFVGTGFRALLEKDEEGKERLLLRVGYCVPIKMDIPEGIKVQLPLPHRMIIEGNDKQQVKLFAANIRKHRKPEPYKGKGIFVDGETIKLKARKIK